MKTKPNIIAVCGKGGVGKTSISALIIKILQKETGKRILAIDADPAVGLSIALGVQIKRTVDDIRKAVVEAVREGKKEDKLTILKQLDYEIFEAITEKDGFAFLAIGRPESAGCYCKVNSYLKRIIEVIAGQFDYVVIDGEAGVEQINRRVMNQVTHLLMVSDPSLRGLKVVETIHRVSSSVIKYDRAGCIINRVREGEDADLINLDSIELIGMMKEDDQLRRADIKGIPIQDLSEESSFTAIREALVTFNVIDAGSRML